MALAIFAVAAMPRAYKGPESSHVVVEVMPTAAEASCPIAPIMAVFMYITMV